jgi:hypothetical protein
VLNELDTSITSTPTITPSDGTFGGTLSKAAVGGIVTFDDIDPLAIVDGVTFDVSDGVLTDDTSDAVDILRPAGGGGVTIPLETEPMATPVLKNTTTATKRRIYLNVWNDDGTPWSGSVTGVKVTINGTASTNDIVRVAGALHYIELTRDESNTSEPVITAVLAASGSRLAAQGIGLVSETDFTLAAASASDVNAAIEAGAVGTAVAALPSASDSITAQTAETKRLIGTVQRGGTNGNGTLAVDGDTLFDARMVPPLLRACRLTLVLPLVPAMVPATRRTNTPARQT